MAKITIDRARYLVLDGDKEIRLSPREFDLLTLLSKMDGKVVSRKKILGKFWGRISNYNTRTIDQHVARIRRKIGDGRIRTVTTRGYSIGNLG